MAHPVSQKQKQKWMEIIQKQKDGLPIRLRMWSILRIMSVPKNEDHKADLINLVLLPQS